jgi:hypothetical protein
METCSVAIVVAGVEGAISLSHAELWKSSIVHIPQFAILIIKYLHSLIFCGTANLRLMVGDQSAQGPRDECARFCGCGRGTHMAKLVGRSIIGRLGRAVLILCEVAGTERPACQKAITPGKIPR